MRLNVQERLFVLHAMSSMALIMRGEKNPKVVAERGLQLAFEIGESFEELITKIQEAVEASTPDADSQVVAIEQIKPKKSTKKKPLPKKRR